MNSDFYALVTRLESIHPLPPDAADRIVPLLSYLALPRGSYFVRAGDVPAKVGYMVKGWLRYFYTDADGKEFVRYFCSGGNFVSSQSAMIQNEPSTYSIQALEDAALITFSYGEWLKLLEEHPAWGIINKTILDQALIRAEQRERSLIMDDAATRYRQFLEEFPDAEEHVKQYDIASYLGVSPVTLSRIRSSQSLT